MDHPKLDSPDKFLEYLSSTRKGLYRVLSAIHNNIMYDLSESMFHSISYAVCNRTVRSVAPGPP